MANKIPILLITGFLGSGKTTFINWILKNKPEAKISLILNEFGEVKLETQFVKYHAENIAELANGCMCCVAKSDIPRVINFILKNSPQTEYILIEASGLSNPDPVRESLQSYPVNQHTFLESTVCIVDAQNFDTYRQQHPIISAQLADSDLVLIVKAQLVSPEVVSKIQTLLARIIPDVKTLVFNDQLNADIFLQPQSELVQKQAHADSSHQHLHDNYQTHIFTNNQFFDGDKLIEKISHLPKNIIRVKAVVNCQDKQGEQFKLLLQRIGGHVDYQEDDQPTNESTILLVGQQMNVAKIEQELMECAI